MPCRSAVSNIFKGDPAERCLLFMPTLYGTPRDYIQSVQQWPARICHTSACPSAQAFTGAHRSFFFSCTLCFIPSSLNRRPTHPSNIHHFLYCIRKWTPPIRKRESNPCDRDYCIRPSRLRVFAIVHHLLHRRHVLRPLNLRQEYSHDRQSSWLS